MPLMTLGVLFLLADGADAVPPPRPQDEIVCRSYVETGSLARRKKECRTRKEWGAIGRGSREEAEQLQERSLRHFSREPT